ncbi:MAG: RNA-directed DNA polymerase, partial [Bacteroidota bacterium]
MPTRRYKITKDELKEAYIKYKAHVYHDSSELYQRRKLAEFETGLLSDELWFGSTPYGSGFETINLEVDKKFDKILDWLNSHHTKKGFNQFLDDINLLFLPKKFVRKDEEENFITNKRVFDTYEIDRVTVFADIPVELHLVTVLWIMRYGYKLDAKLDMCCVGNRLLLNKSNNAVIKGSGLFKPYFTQYQKWRDNAVEEAQRKLHSGSKVAFINLDLKDYFYSARIDFDAIEKEIWGKEGYKNDSNIHDIFKELHKRYTDKLKATKYPNAELENQIGDKCILPIGIASSYVLGNFYLREFDKRIKKLIPQVYYCRYVDDILVVIENPDFTFHTTEECKSIKFSFEKYIKEVTKEKESVSFSEKDFSKTEKFILETFYPLIRLVDYPDFLKSVPQSEKDKKDETRIFKITCIEGAYFQPKKTLLYYFDSKESTAVIDKLKQELEERASEF